MTNKTQWWQGQFDFIKLPKQLFRSAEYQAVSPLAKLLYGFLLDRTSLSSASGSLWETENGEYFVFFPISEIMERFCCGHDKAASLLQELEEVHLISRTRKSRSQPYQIIVQPFPMNTEKPRPVSRKIRKVDLGNSVHNKTEHIKTDFNYTDTITASDREMVSKKTKSNICYDVLLKQVPLPILDGIVDIITDTICSSEPAVKISGTTIPMQEVQRRFLELDQMDIAYIWDSMKTETHKIKSPRGYILARLYEAHNFSDLFYDQWLRFDEASTPDSDNVQKFAGR